MSAGEASAGHDNVDIAALHAAAVIYSAVVLTEDGLWSPVSMVVSLTVLLAFAAFVLGSPRWPAAPVAHKVATGAALTLLVLVICAWPAQLFIDRDCSYDAFDPSVQQDESAQEREAEGFVSWRDRCGGSPYPEERPSVKAPVQREISRSRTGRRGR